MGASAAAIAFVPIEEYLRTSYEPDVDYVDGYLEDRHVGETEHADLQGELLRSCEQMRKNGAFTLFLNYESR